MKDGYTAYPIRATASLMPFDVFEPGAWLLTGIEVAYHDRGRGVARGLLKQILTDADSEQVTLCLSVEPDGTGLDAEQLTAWYRRHGFVPLDMDNPRSMVRRPQ